MLIALLVGMVAFATVAKLVTALVIVAAVTNKIFVFALMFHLYLTSMTFPNMEVCVDAETYYAFSPLTP